jgi:hypothetical protein
VRLHACKVDAYKIYARKVHTYDLRVFLARRARVARNRVSTPMMFKASDCGRLGRQAAGHPKSALRVVKSCQKDCPTAEILLEAKSAALRPERYQAQAIGLDSQSDRQKSDGQTGHRQTG